MPAINVERLTAQVNHLTISFNQPQEFIRKLKDIFDFYADRTYRKGEEVYQIKQIPVFYIPNQVIQEIVQNLRSKAQSAPLVLLNLCDALWEVDIYESKLIAGKIAACIPIEYLETILIITVNWLKECPDTSLQDVIIKESLHAARRQNPKRYLDIFSKFLYSTNVKEVKIGLSALLPLLDDESFLDLPSVYQSLLPLVKSFPNNVIYDLITIFTLLSKKSQVETLHFITQIYSLNPSSNMQTLIRSIIPYYSSKHQTILRNMINKN